jgi:membrane-associated protein
MISNLTDLISAYGLVAVFVGAFIEGEGVLIAAGILAGEGLLHPVSVWWIASVGAWLGHLFWFLIGRRLGRRYLLPRFKGISERIQRADGIIQHHPGTAIFILQYLYGTRMIGAVAFGLTRLSFGRFLFFEALNCPVWAALVESAGYLLGEVVIRLFHNWVKWIWLALSVIVFVWIFQHLKPIAFGKGKSE